MTSNAYAHVHVVHLDWGTFSSVEPVIMASWDEPTAYVRTARFLIRDTRDWLEEDVQEAYDTFVTDNPYDPDTATPEQAKEWVTTYAESDLYPLFTIEEAQVLP